MIGRLSDELVAAWQRRRVAEGQPGRLSGDLVSEMDLPDWRSIHDTLETRCHTGWE